MNLLYIVFLLKLMLIGCFNRSRCWELGGVGFVLFYCVIDFWSFVFIFGFIVYRILRKWCVVFGRLGWEGNIELVY